MRVEITVLGELGGRVDGEPVDLGPPQQRALLALLALRRGETVSTGALIDALWPAGAPGSATKIVQGYVSRLRRTLGPQAIRRNGAGYVLDPAIVSVDAARFRDRVAARDVAGALELWRGRPLADLRGVPDLEREATELDELFLHVQEERIEAALEEGRAASLVAELQSLAAEHPLRERLAALLMLALYRAGRQSEALDLYRRTRRTLVEEIGVEPSATLRELHRRMLEQDPTLLGHDLAPATIRPRVPAPQDPDAGRAPPGAPLPGPSHRGVTAPPATRRWRPPVLLGLVGVAAAAVVSAAVALPALRDSPVPPVRPDSVVRIDGETNEVAEVVPIGRDPAALAVTGRVLWVANAGSRVLVRHDTATGRQDIVGGIAQVQQVAADARGNVYVAGFDDPFVWRVAPRSLRPTYRYRVGTRAVSVAAGGGLLWVVDRLADVVRRFDLQTGVEQLPPVAVGDDPLAIEFAYGALWVTNRADGTVSVLRPGETEPKTIVVDSSPLGIAAGYGAIWVAGMAHATRHADRRRHLRGERPDSAADDERLRDADRLGRSGSGRRVGHESGGSHGDAHRPGHRRGRHDDPPGRVAHRRRRRRRGRLGLRRGSRLAVGGPERLRARGLAVPRTGASWAVSDPSTGRLPRIDRPLR